VSCTHIRKGIEQSLLKKAGLDEHWSVCQDCEPDKPVEKQILEDETDRESPAVWMCLKCGHRGCGRSENQHAIKHYETPRSEPHCLVLSLDVWSVWCYICDDEVQYCSTGKLAQLITNIRKEVLADPVKRNSNKMPNQITDEKSCFTITPALSSELGPLQVQLERPGSLTLAMCQFLNEIHETKKGVVTPKELFTQVCKNLLVASLGQRRQQKLGSKVALDSLTNQSTASSTDPADASNQSVSVNGSVDAESGENIQEHLSLEKPPACSQNEDEDDEEPEQEHATSVNNRFTALSEDQTTEDVSVEGEEIEDVNAIEKEDCAHQLCDEEDQLVEELNAVSLKTASEDEMENGDEASGDAKEYTVVNQDPELAFQSLASRAAPEKQECSVESCLYQFTEVEHLTENNRLMCVTCTKRQSGHKAADGCKKAVYRDALKQMLISDPPAVLTLHLKRFQQVGYSVCKVNRHVQFPQILDLAPFCSLNCKGVKEGETRVLYSLYGIVEHSGTMRSGHYTAYIKSRPSTHNYVENGLDAGSGHAEASKGSWFHISDSSVHPVPEAKVQSSQAYLLFYEKIS
ncbi:ubiquitin carboxyl-terminal hydrolase 16-like, partial [Sinocyclocheilus grahami]|uniref:ubiquitin carboxyl-terminal hydrolase 16-like n=1 Tax=Sinocyclocheilus grahami TaxID=75366 RepID=UPI0007AC6E81